MGKVRNPRNLMIDPFALRPETRHPINRGLEGLEGGSASNKPAGLINCTYKVAVVAVTFVSYYSCSSGIIEAERYFQLIVKLNRNQPVRLPMQVMNDWILRNRNGDDLIIKPAKW